MAMGRQSRALRPDQIERLTKYRLQRRYSLPQLNAAMDSPFTWQVLKRALAGQPIWELNHRYIVEWLDQWMPSHQVPDGKLAATGDN